jgi:hypothetical protein
MAGEPENLILVALRRMDEKFDRMGGDLRDLKLRMTSVERQLVDLRGDIAGVRGDMVSLTDRMDRMDDRLERIERRLDLVSGPSPR